jgi:isopentenyl-diphosphate Delta-isomerase
VTERYKRVESGASGAFDLARDRKEEHLSLALRPDVRHASGTGLERMRMRHRALPGHDLDDVSLATSFVGHALQAPLIISSMTGGTHRAKEVNRSLARAAAAFGVGMALGSGRKLLEEPALLATYRPSARPPLWLANLGASQLLGETGISEAVRLVEMVGADGLVIHLNPVQEAIQPEGDTRFAGAVDAIARTVEQLRPLPVIVKEVGFGMDADDVRLLDGAGVMAIDVAGAGGTNWALIEGHRDPLSARLASAFADWGISTADALVAARDAAPGLQLIASGGIRDGVEAAKSLALGADLVGIASTLLSAAMAGHLDEELEIILRQLRIATWAVGAASVADLDRRHLLP